MVPGTRTKVAGLPWACVLLVLGILLGSLFAPAQALADPGVGMSSGNIVVDDQLSLGRTYHLPSISITNTGAAPGAYEMVLSYKIGHKRLPVPADWITFDPAQFFLNPQQSQNVAVILDVPATGVRPETTSLSSSLMWWLKRQERLLARRLPPG